jgi:hypothetical protein
VPLPRGYEWRDLTPKEPVCALVDGEPHRGMKLPDNVKFVGMEKDPNRPPRYGKVWHPWHNLPCYETVRHE